ncbi:MAG: (deoxy)nucleoside triphosphate pyrophosphohydrolase [Lachnospiraceae bacterium]|nr:(deoxy)nucleoside triphosphate pyrophosphohydrolase [Lachnospiraceae bacterium]
MKIVRVAAAVIRSRNESGEPVIFATQRGYGEYKDWWEFPGGKLEAGETPEQALVREIREELTAVIRGGILIHTLEDDYPAFHLSMDCFWAEVVGGELVLKEAEAAGWLTKDELRSVNWLPADIEILDLIAAGM